MMRLSSLLLLAAITMLQFTCTQGTGSEVEGRSVIEGRAVDKQGNPVAGAIVRMRPIGFLALHADDFSVFDTFTDKNGRFHFDTIPVDSYTIEINKDGRIGSLVELNVASYDSFPIVLPADTLTPTGTIYGRINLPISDDTSRPWVALYNVDYMVKAPLTQDFRFVGVPEGVYNLRLVPALRSNFVMELLGVSVHGDSIVDVGTLTLFALDFFKGCASYGCDSTAIRSILDANGLSGVSVASVATTDSADGRVVALDLSGRSITMITKNIGSLSRLVSLDLGNNRIASLPEHVGYLNKLVYCHLDSNELYELPSAFCYLDRLRELTVSNNKLFTIDKELFDLRLNRLDLRNNRIEVLPELDGLPAQDMLLDNNELQTLPVNIVLLYGPQVFAVRNNRLCNIAASVGQWLAGFDPQWKESQQCQ